MLRLGLLLVVEDLPNDREWSKVLARVGCLVFFPRALMLTWCQTDQSLL